MKTKLSNEYKQALAQNLEDVKSRMAGANRLGQDVTLLCATKTVDPEVINYVTKELGVTHIGENRVQELLDKYDALYKENVNIHFIGSLQTNKVKYIIDKVSMIHSLDSVKLAKEIDRQAQKHGKVMDVLVEINIAEEENKGGIAPGEVEAFLSEIAGFEHIRVCGFMTMAPFWSEKEDYYKYFEKTYAIFLDFLKKKPHNIINPVLSMGMSDSFEYAIACGSNMIRVGTTVFGVRNYNQ